MGGMHGEVRGKTKLAVWKKFQPMTARDYEPAGLHLDTAKNKKDAFKSMKRDPNTGEWVLWYHFGK